MKKGCLEEMVCDIYPKDDKGSAKELSAVVGMWLVLYTFTCLKLGPQCGKKRSFGIFMRWGLMGGL